LQTADKTPQPIFEDSVMAIFPFLTFNGNCKEAMRFYHSCFGGKLRFTYLGEAPFGRDLPEDMQTLVVQASLVSEHISLFASDMSSNEGLYAGNSISLLISMKRDEQLKTIFSRLSRKGEVTGPLSQDIQTGEWATLTDKYSVQWIFEILDE
jgi:PhnB protein